MRRFWWYVGVLSLSIGGAAVACGDDSTSDTGASSAGGGTSGQPAAEALDLLYISDSSGWGVAEQYARLAAEELGRPVNVIDWRSPGLSLMEAQQKIADRPERVAEAEIIVIEGNPFGSGVREGFGECMDEFSPVSPGLYTVEDFAPYQALMVDVLAAVADARAGQPTVVRVADIYVADPEAWVARGLDTDCRSIWDASYQAIQNAVDEGGAVFVSAYDVYNGPEHDQDPVALGYVQKDRVHPSDTGSALMAAALHAAGYAELDK